MPPPRRRPASPPARRPKVAGLRRRDHEQPEDQPVSGTLDAAEVEQATAAQQDTPAVSAEPEPVPEAAPRRRRPSPKRRDTGVTVGADTDTIVEDPAPVRRSRRRDPVAAVESDVVTEAPASAEDTEDTTEDDLGTDLAEPVEDETAERTPSYLLPILLLVAALLLGGLAYWFAQQLSDARVGSGNDALSDVNATKDVVGAAQQAVAGVLSYKFDDMAGSTTRAKAFLDGEAIGQYDASMKALEKEIQDQKLQVVVNPVSIGVVRLAGDDARVLVFADQVGARADNQPSGGPTQFAMDMHRTNGRWKIVKLDFFETR